MALPTLISQPCASLQGEITPPGDKSIAHRALLIASLAEGCSEILGLPKAHDVLTTRHILQQLGIEIKKRNQTWHVFGKGYQAFSPPEHTLYLGNSGTTMRLLTGILVGQRFPSTIEGDDSLNRRPMHRIIAPLRQMGVNIQAKADNYPPMRINPVPKLHPILYDIPIASAQVKSCLLLAALHIPQKTTLREYHMTRDHTENLLHQFGCPIRKNHRTIMLSGLQPLQPQQIIIPGDISSAMFFIVAATLIPRSNILIKHVGLNTTRFGGIRMLQHMGANIDIQKTGSYHGEPVGNIHVKSSKLKGIEIPAAWVPSAIDEIPILAIAATQAEGYTSFLGLNELRFKETDRLKGIATNLQALRAQVKLMGNQLVIQHSRLHGGVVDSMKDHRLAMAFLIAGAIAKEPVLVKNCYIGVSYPEFCEQAQLLGMEFMDTVS